jgi:uncharacterized oligopeptide transporter (OPT) family protein
MYQQLALFIGAIVSSVAIGWVVHMLDTPNKAEVAQGVIHAIGGDRFSAPQATLMATLARGILSFNLDWQFVMVGFFIAVMIELCGIKALAFAIGLYLPLATTLPIFIGGAIKGIVDWGAERKKEVVEDGDLGKGSLFATGLIAGGALSGVLVALLSVNEKVFDFLLKISAEEKLVTVLGTVGYSLVGVASFTAMATVLYRNAIQKNE